MTTPDPFAQSFDSIDIERAPSPAAIESAFAATQAGFFLLDDANGRFTVDREMGVVMLTDETLLTREAGAVYPARLRVVEPSGASYDLDMKLRITGLVPQMLGAEDFGFGESAATTTPAPRPRVEWAGFAPALGAQTTRWLAIAGAYGSLLGVTLPAVNVTATIALPDAIPGPSHAQASWLL